MAREVYPLLTDDAGARALQYSLAGNLPASIYARGTPGVYERYLRAGDAARRARHRATGSPLFMGLQQTQQAAHMFG